MIKNNTKNISDIQREIEEYESRIEEQVLINTKAKKKRRILLAVIIFAYIIAIVSSKIYFSYSYEKKIEEYRMYTEERIEEYEEFLESI